MQQTRLESPADDGMLAARALAGDPAAFERLYQDNLGRVYALAIRMTARKSLAEELTQEIFVKAWRKPSIFHG